MLFRQIKQCNHILVTHREFPQVKRTRSALVLGERCYVYACICTCTLHNIIGQAGASPTSRTTGFHVHVHIFLSCVRVRLQYYVLIYTCYGEM